MSKEESPQAMPKKKKELFQKPDQPTARTENPTDKINPNLHEKPKKKP